MTYIAAHYVTKNEEKELIAAFQALDLDGNGVLTVDELLEGRLDVIRLQEDVPSNA